MLAWNGLRVVVSHACTVSTAHFRVVKTACRRRRRCHVERYYTTKEVAYRTGNTLFVGPRAFEAIKKEAQCPST